MHRLIRGVVAGAAALTLATIGTTATAQAATSGDPGDPTITVDINDSEAGGTYEQAFKKVYAGTTRGRHARLHLRPDRCRSAAARPAWQHGPGSSTRTPTTTSRPCADNSASDYVITQAQINYLGDELSNHIVPVDEEHYGPIGLADPHDADSDALVMLVYNVQDESYYDCSVDTYTAGYFAPEYIDEAGMNVIVVDAFDWANRIGDDAEPTAEPLRGRHRPRARAPAHELLRPGRGVVGRRGARGHGDLPQRLSTSAGSHLTYHQVFHRETSLTRWGGGLENYGASFTYFLYLWEQAGGNGDGTYTADSQYDGKGGDLLIKLIFQNAATAWRACRRRSTPYNAQTPAPTCRSAEELFKDWAIAVKLDDEGSNLWDIKNIDFGDPAFTSWTVDIANDQFWNRRGEYFGRMPDARWKNYPKVPDQTALPFGVSYETFRNLGQGAHPGLRGRPDRAGRTAHRRHPLVGWRREPERQHPRRRLRGVPRQTSWTSGPGTSSRTAGTTASSRPRSTASG